MITSKCVPLYYSYYSIQYKKKVIFSKTTESFYSSAAVVEAGSERLRNM